MPVNYSLKIQLFLLKSYAVRFVKRRHAGNSLFLPDRDKIWKLPNNLGVVVVLRVSNNYLCLAKILWHMAKLLLWKD